MRRRVPAARAKPPSCGSGFPAGSAAGGAAPGQCLRRVQPVLRQGQDRHRTRNRSGLCRVAVPSQERQETFHQPGPGGSAGRTVLHGPEAGDGHRIREPDAGNPGGRAPGPFLSPAACRLRVRQVGREAACRRSRGDASAAQGPDCPGPFRTEKGKRPGDPSVRYGSSGGPQGSGGKKRGRLRRQPP